MRKYFMQDTPLAWVEKFMMQPPNYHRRTGKEFEIELSRPGRFGATTATTLTLPAAWTEIKDALDKARITDDRVIYGIEVLEAKREYLKARIPDNANLYELSHLAEQLSEMNKQEADCFEGMVKMEASEKSTYPGLFI